MYAVSVFGSPAWLIPFGPNTEDSVSVRARVVSNITRGQTGRSSRRPKAYLLRFQQGWISSLRASDFFLARTAALSAESEPIVAPFWLAARKTTQAALMTSGLTVAWTADWATYAINPGSLAGYDYFAPLLMGRLKQPPRIISRTSDNIVAEFVLDEQSLSTAALVPPVDVDVTVATPDAYAAAVFPFTPEPSSAPKLSLPQVEVETQELGAGRLPSVSYYPQPRESVVQPAYKLKSSTDAVALLGWWHRRAGGADSCWVATTQKIGDLTGDLAAGATAIPTVAPMTVASGDTLALLTTGLAPEFVRVQSLLGGVPQLSAPTAVAHSKRWTVVVPALLARHTDDELSLDLVRAGNDWIATTTLGFREVGSEYAATDGEVRGTTIGRLPAEARLFRIDLDYAGATQSWFLTNWESGCTTPDAQVWEYRDCDLDRLVQSINLEDDTSTFHVRWWAGCPWENWRPGKLSATGVLTYYKAPVSFGGGVGAPVAQWAGNLSTPERDGAILAVKVLGGNTIFASKMPHQLMRKPCWKKLYGTACGVILSEWKHNGTVSLINGQQLTIGAIARTDGNPAHDGFGFANWFGLGWAEWINGAGQPVRASVLASTALAGGEITLTLSRPLGCAVGNTVVVVPGCDKTKESCWIYDAVNNPRGKFNNFNAHGGFWDIPAVSPNLVIPNSSQNPAKK